MDLGMMINQSANRIRKNWILVIPPILTQVVVPFALFAVAAFTILPLVAAYSLTGDIGGLIQTAVVGALLLAIVGFLVDTFVTAGWAYMNKRAVVDGQTRLGDLLVGAKKYFLRILGGRILVGIAVIVPIAAGIGALAASILTLNIGPLTPPEQLTPETIIGLLAPMILGLLGILVVVGLIELVLYIFLLPWMQALVMEDLGIWGSIKTSVRFVRRNFATMIGYVVISAIAWIAVSWATSFLWPSFSYSELTRPALYASGTRLLGLMLRASNLANSMITALLSAFFTLLLFIIYADRTRGLVAPTGAEGFAAAPATQVPPPAPSGGRLAPRGMKYCVNCGAALISLAVFCPSCGARQPPLAPE